MVRGRFVHLILVWMFLMSILTSCNRTEAVYSPTINQQEEPMDISIALWDYSGQDTELDPLMKKLEEKLNIRLRPIPITDTDYIQQYQIWAASGNLPDVFAIDAVSSDYMKNWEERGIIRPIPKDLSDYPLLAKYLSNPDFQYLKRGEQFYSIPRQTYVNTDYNVIDRIVAYRWDLAQQSGITKEPETWDEFQAMLSAIVKKDPEQQHIIGLTSVNNILISGLFWLYSNPVATSDGSGSDFKWIWEDGKYIPAVFSKNAIDSLKMLRNFYTSGVIDPNITVTRGAMAFDKFANGKAAAVLMSGGIDSLDIYMYKDRWLKLHPGDRDFYSKVKLLKPLRAIDGNRYHPIFKSYWSESYISSKVNDDKLQRILQLFEYMNTTEFKEMRHYGQLGIDYTKQGDQIILKHPDINVQDKYKQFAAFSNLLEWDGMFKLTPDYSAITSEAQNAQKELIDYSLKHTIQQKYNIGLTYLSTPTKDKFKIFDNDDMIRVMLSKQSVEKEWHDIIAKYQAKGLNQMIKEVNSLVQHP